jgi:hypothetical protein
MKQRVFPHAKNTKTGDTRSLQIAQESKDAQRSIVNSLRKGVCV